MPRKDYEFLIGVANVNPDQREKLLSGDPDLIEELLMGGYQGKKYNFTEDEIAFLKTVKAKTFSDFVRQTDGYWKD